MGSVRRVIRFNGADGQYRILVITDNALLSQAMASPDDMARAYYALTDEQATQMASAYTKLRPRQPQRPFDELLATELAKTEVKLLQLRTAAAEYLKWGESEYQSNPRITDALKAALKASEP